MIDVDPMDVPDAEAEWAAWEARCRVSHAEHFASLRNPRVAFHRPAKPQALLRVALATSGGLYVHGMAPFDLGSHAGDDSVRWIPGDVDTRNLRFAHDHYDHTDPDRDPNCIFPLDRLRELAAEGLIGGVAGWHVGFMGWIPDPRRFARERVPEITARLLKDGVDAVVLSPG
ncbi:MAG: glycine/sarcosine/betaine reductase selenoprotein B family protein [bacterium]